MLVGATSSVSKQSWRERPVSRLNNSITSSVTPDRR